MTLWRMVLVAIAGVVMCMELPARADTVGLFARADETWGARVSPDGRYLALGCSPRAVREVCVYKIDSDERPKLFPAAKDARITGFYWVSDKHLIVETNYFETLKTSSGLRDYRINRAISFNVVTGNSEPLMKGKMYVTDTTGIDALLPSQPDKVLLTYRFAGSGSVAGSRLTGGYDRRTEYEVDLNTGKARQLPDQSRIDGAPFYDADGKIVAIIKYDGPGSDYTIINIRDGGNTVYLEDKAQSPPFDRIWGLSGDAQALIVTVDNSENLGLKYLSLTTGEIEDVKYRDQGVGDVRAIRDQMTNGLIGFGYTDGLYKQVFIDPVLADTQDGLAGALGKTINVLSWSRDKRLVTVSASQEGVPSDYYLFDSEAGSVSHIGGEAPWLSDVALGQVSHITYTAEDGLEIRAVLTLPAGKSEQDGPFPLILLPHGGPEVTQTAEYDWWAQAYAASGYVVLQPNFRGSTGVSAAFRNAGYGEFGGKMVTDVLDGAAYLVQEGIASGDGYCVAGASYGGYSALMSGLLRPDQARCLIAVNAVTDPFSMIGEYVKAGGHDALGVQYWQRYIGQSVFSSADTKRTITPVSRSSELSMPLLLIHGKEDTTVPFGHSSRLNRELRRRPHFRFVRMEGQDHYLSSTAARETVLRESLDFLAEHHPAR